MTLQARKSKQINLKYHHVKQRTYFKNISQLRGYFKGIYLLNYLNS